MADRSEALALLEQLRSKKPTVRGVDPTMVNPVLKLDPTVDASLGDAQTTLGKILEEVASENVGDGGNIPSSEPEELSFIDDVSRWFDDVILGGPRTTPETKSLPELSYSRGIGADQANDELLTTAASLMFVVNDDAKVDIVEKNLGAKTTQDRHGTVFFEFPDGKKAVLNKPGFSYQDVLETVGDIAAFLGPSKIATLGKALWAKLIIGGAAAGLTEVGLETGAQAAGSEQGYDPTAIGLAAVTGAGGELAEAGVKRFTRARKAKRLGMQGSLEEEFAEAAKQSKRAGALTEATGVEFSRPQKTLATRDLERQSYLAQLSGSEKEAYAFIRKQNQQAADAVEDTLKGIADPEAIETAAGDVRNVSQKILKGLEEVRRAKAKPFYDRAFLDTKFYPTRDTKALITGHLEDLPTKSPLAKALMEAEDFITPKAGKPKRKTVKRSFKNLKTGDPISFEYVRNTEPAPYMGKTYQQHLEPSGQYVSKRSGKSEPPVGWEVGRKKFESPLVIDWNTNPSGGYDSSNWKARLSNEYGGLTGEKLSKAIAADGYDGIVTLDSGKLPSEIVDISRWYTPSPGVKPGTPLIRGLRVKQMDAAQKQIGSLIGQATRSGDRRTASVLTEVREALLKELDDVNPDYQTARQLYREASIPIDKYKQSILGKVGKLDDSQLDSISARLFRPEMNPATMRKTKELIEKQDPQVWRDILRVEFEKRIGDPTAYLDEGGAMTNVPGKLYNALGFNNPKRRKVLYSAMDTESAKNLRYLEESLNRARKGRPGGSQTAVRQDFERELKGVGGVIQGIFSAPYQSLARGVPLTLGIGSEYTFNQNAKTLAKIMFDPKWQPELTQLRGVNPTSPSAAKSFRSIWARALSDLPKPAMQTLRPSQDTKEY